MALICERGRNFATERFFHHGFDVFEMLGSVCYDIVTSRIKKEIGTQYKSVSKRCCYRLIDYTTIPDKFNDIGAGALNKTFPKSAENICSAFWQFEKLRHPLEEARQYCITTIKKFFLVRGK